MSLDNHYIWQAILSLAIVVFTTVTCGLLVANGRSRWLGHAMPHFISVGTGMLLAICFADFLPQAFKAQGEHTPFLLLLGLLIVIIGDRYLAPKILPAAESCDDHSHDHPEGHHHSPGRHGVFFSPHAACSSIGCILVCAFFDGIEIPAAFELGQKTGYLVSLGMLFHTIPEGALAASIGLSGGLSKKGTSMSVILVGVGVLLGGLTTIFVSQVMDFQSVVLPIATGVLLYTGLGHLLPAALRARFGLVGIALGAAFIMFLGHGH